MRMKNITDQVYANYEKYSRKKNIYVCIDGIFYQSNLKDDNITYPTEVYKLVK